MTATAVPASVSHRPTFLVPAELSLFCVTAATVYGFSRVFDSLAFLGPLMLFAVYSHVVFAATRRHGFGVTLSFGLGLVGFVLLISYSFFYDSTSYGIPWAGTATAIGEALRASWQTFAEVQAPAPVQLGFVLASSIAIFLAVFLADWAAFRLWSPFEALVPATTLFFFCSLLGSTIHRLDAALAFVSSAVVFYLLHRIARRETTAGWLASEVTRGSASLLRTGLYICVLALLAGILIGPRAPGAQAGAILSWRESNGQKGDRFTVSPLVEINGRLNAQPTIEMFTVDSSQEAYWRLTALDTFDGNSWRSRGKFTVAEGTLGEPQAGVTSTEFEQKFELSGLGGLWLPAAYEPIRVSETAHARYHPDSGTLIVDTDFENNVGFTYSVESAAPTFEPEQLRSADTAVPTDVAERYLPLPPNFSEKAKRDAEEHAKGSTPFDRLRSLQDWFRSPAFTYDDKVQAGHGEAAIDAFLTTKKGYCEQFAGTFAAMARSLGYPARVAVGFTPGERDATHPSQFHVYGRNAHAWPEVYLGQFGWVHFEPTPGRGLDQMLPWTGARSAQAGSESPAAATTSTALRASTSVVPSTQALGNAVQAVPPPQATATAPDEARSWYQAIQFRVALAMAIVVLAGAGYVFGMAAAYEKRRTKRRGRARDASFRVRVAWTESLEELALLGMVPRPSETHDEFASRAARTVPELADQLVTLGNDADVATFAPDMVGDDLVARSEGTVKTLTAIVVERTGAMDHWRRRIDPRNLFGHKPGHESRQQASSHG